MKLTIDCTDEQAKILLKCLEESFRFPLRQPGLFLENIFWETEQFEHRDDAESVCSALMDIIYGKNCTEHTPETDVIIDMWHVLRHELYLANGGDPNNYMDVRSDKTIKLGDMPMIKVEVEK